MKKMLLVALICSSFVTVFSEETQSFVKPKKTSCDKPSKIKEDIADTLESLLTCSFDLVASITEMQRELVKEAHNLAQGTENFEHTSVHALKKRLDFLKSVECEYQKTIETMQRQIKTMKNFV
jgi:hypothetical protein